MNHPASFNNSNVSGPISTINNNNNNPTVGSNVPSSGSNYSRTPSSSTWINKLKIVGRGQNWAVTPCEPFYLMGLEPPALDGAITGARNLIEHYGLESAYQKFCGKRLKEELSAFLPHLSGNIDVPASIDGSGLMNLIERPPIRGKDLRPFAPNQLDHAFRLHPGPLPQEYSSLFAAAPLTKANHLSSSQTNLLSLTSGASNGSRLPATAAPNLANSNSTSHRKRRYEVHRGGSALGGSTITNGTPSFFTNPPSAFAQLVSGGTSLSSVNHPSSASLVNSHQVAESATKAGDLPPGLIPVSISATSNTTFSSEVPPPPPPLLAPIHHHNSSQRLLTVHGSVIPPNSDSPINVNPSGVKSGIPAPPLLQSIHTPSGPTQTAYNSLNTQSYLVMQSPSVSSPPSPDTYTNNSTNKMRHADLSEEERRKKKRREKKRRKDKD